MWISDESIFKILEIEPTTDKKVIKKAYAKLVKKYHPEEYPDKWKEIHAAYEEAIARAERGGQVGLKILTADDDKIVISVVKNGEPEKTGMPEKPAGNQPESVIKTEKLEESDELISLFDHIDILSKEQQKQDEEAFRSGLQEVLRDFGKISGRKRLYLKEWKDFFFQEARLPYICTKEFLEMLGDCFTNRKIDTQMYQFLKEQLQLIGQYSRERNMELQKIGGLDPLAYAERKISIAYGGGKSARIRRSLAFIIGEAKKAVIVILVIAGIIIRLNGGFPGRSRNDPEHPQIQEITESMRTELVTYNEELAHPNIPGLPERAPQIGDTKEQMIEWLGEPDELQISEEDPEHEEAVYRPADSGIKLIIILDDEIITDIQVEYESE